MSIENAQQINDFRLVTEELPLMLDDELLPDLPPESPRSTWWLWVGSALVASGGAAGLGALVVLAVSVGVSAWIFMPGTAEIPAPEAVVAVAAEAPTGPEEKAANAPAEPVEARVNVAPTPRAAAPASPPVAPSPPVAQAGSERPIPTAAPKASASGLHQVRLLTVPAGAEIIVDGQAVGASPAQVELDAGPHHVEVRRKKASGSFEIAVGPQESWCFAVRGKSVVDSCL